MTRLPRDDEDDRLVNFLNQYRPVPPPLSSQLEEKLIQRIEHEPITSKYSSHWLWVLSSAFGAVLLMIWISYRWLRPSPQIATNSEEIETFMIDSWVSTTEDTFSTSSMNNSNVYWLTLADYQLEINSSNSITY